MTLGRLRVQTATTTTKKSLCMVHTVRKHRRAERDPGNRQGGRGGACGPKSCTWAIILLLDERNVWGRKLKL